MTTLTLGLFDFWNLRWPLGLLCKLPWQTWVADSYRGSNDGVCRGLLPWARFCFSPTLWFLYFDQSLLPSLYMDLRLLETPFCYSFCRGLSLVKAWAYCVWLQSSFVIGFWLSCLYAGNSTTPCILTSSQPFLKLTHTSVDSCEKHQSPIISILGENEGLAVFSIDRSVTVRSGLHLFHFQLRWVKKIIKSYCCLLFHSA